MEDVGVILVGEEGVSARQDEFLCDGGVPFFDGDHEQRFAGDFLPCVLTGAFSMVSGYSYMRSSMKVSLFS